MKKSNKRTSVLKESERFCLENYEDIKFAINENMLKADKENKVKENNKSDMQGYYDILVFYKFFKNKILFTKKKPIFFR